jgi:transcriptional regulator with XRE-family HTH domain
MPMKRHRLAARRRARGYSQETFAEALKVDRTTITRWETAESEPQPWHRRKIAKVLDVSLEELDEMLSDAINTSDTESSRTSGPAGGWRTQTSPVSSNRILNSVADRSMGDETNRRSAIALVTRGLGAAAGMSIFDVGFPAPSRGHRIDSRLMASYVEAADALAGLYRTVDSRVILPAATRFADELLELYDGRADTAPIGLVDLVVNVHCQVGLWACHAHLTALARRYLATACDLAATAGTPVVWARALGALSYLHSSAPHGGDGGNPGRALEILDHAHTLAMSADAFTRGWLATWRADQYATLGEIAAAQADVELALTMLEVGDDSPEHGFFSRRHYGYGMRGHLNSVRGLAHSLAGEVDEAQRIFHDVQTKAANTRRRVATFAHRVDHTCGRGALSYGPETSLRCPCELPSELGQPA